MVSVVIAPVRCSAQTVRASRAMYVLHVSQASGVLSVKTAARKTAGRMTTVSLSNVTRTQVLVRMVVIQDIMALSVKHHAIATASPTSVTETRAIALAVH